MRFIIFNNKNRVENKTIIIVLFSRCLQQLHACLVGEIWMLVLIYWEIIVSEFRYLLNVQYVHAYIT